MEALEIFSKPLISLEPPSVLLSVTDLKGEGSGSACTERSCNELNGCDDDDNFLESHCIGGDYIQNRSPGGLLGFWACLTSSFVPLALRPCERGIGDHHLLF